MKEVRYTLTEEDLLAAARLHDRTANLQRFGMYALLLPALLALYLVWVELTTPETASLSRVLIPSAIVLAATAMASAIVWLFRQNVTLPRVSRQMLAGNAALRREQTVRWDAQQIEFASERSHSTEDLPNFTKWLSGKDAFLLFRGDFSFHPIPKRCFLDSASLDDLIRGLMAAGVKGKRLDR